MYEKNYFILTIFFILIISTLRLLLIPSFNLVPQEAYYWLYIQHPALSYFDHPPICSYTIGLFTKFLGNSELGVRFGILLYSIGTMVFIFLLSKNIFKSLATAFITIIFLNLTIFFNVHSIVATPDSPLLFFWSGSMFYYYKALKNDKSNLFWILGGIFSGFAIYSKYSGIFIYVSFFLFLLFSKYRRLLLSYKPYLALAISFIVFSPVIYWNANNQWASFLFQSKGRVEGMGKFTLNYFFQLIASQLFELTPLFFILGIAVFLNLCRFYRYLPEDEKFLFWFAYPTIFAFFLISFTTLVKMNWILPAYLSMLIIISKRFELYAGKTKKNIKYFGFTTSIGLIVFTFLIIVLPLFPIERGDTWTGWKELSKKVTWLIENKFKNKKVFIFSNDYKIPAELSFYTKFRKIILAENVYGQKALQFDYWLNPKEFEHWDGILIFSDFNKFSDFKLLSRYFDEIVLIELFDVKKKNRIFRRFWLYYCKNFQIK